MVSRTCLGAAEVAWSCAGPGCGDGRGGSGVNGDVVGWPFPRAEHRTGLTIGVTGVGLRWIGGDNGGGRGLIGSGVVAGLPAVLLSS